jgi:endonuclease/exonuclease/phosphatase family metal-dependent hydrolase
MRLKRSRLLVGVIAVLAVGGILVVGSIRGPAGDATGGAIVVPSAVPTKLRLATFNIHSGVGADNRFDLQRTAAVLKGFDLISLNEIRGATPIEAGQLDELARLLDRRALFAPSERRWWHESFGSAVLFDSTIDGWRRRQLPSGPGMAYRNILRLEMPFGEQKLSVLVSHCGRGTDREPQLRAIGDLFLKEPTPAVLMGDMNSPGDDPTMRKLLETPGVEDPVGRRVSKPRIDYILLRGVNWTDAGLVEGVASDHPMAWVEIVAK